MPRISVLDRPAKRGPNSRSTGVITGIGAAVPERVVDNGEVGTRAGVSDQWIRQRTGISQRRLIAPGEATATLATRAGRSALTSAEVNRVGAVIVATTTPDRVCPAIAPEVASSLGLPGVCAFDINAVCSGFVYGLATANGIIAAGIAGSVLLIGADTFSTIVDASDRSTAIIFGDGAGAVVLRAGEQSELGAVGPFDLGSDGGNSDLAAVAAGGSRQRARGIPPEPGDDYLSMDGRAMYKHAISRMSESATSALLQAGWDVTDVDLLVSHQANVRIIQGVAERVGLPMDRAMVNIASFGNTAAASIPIALADAAATGRVMPAQKVLLTAFGAGLTWASTTMTWPQITTDFAST